MQSDDEKPTNTGAINNNESEEFYNNYKDEFMTLIKFPVIGMCKHNNIMVPYELVPRVIRFRRDEEELNKLLSSDLSSLTMYCFKHDMDKSLLMLVAGGNLWDYYQMKKSFGGMS